VRQNCDHQAGAGFPAPAFFQMQKKFPMQPMLTIILILLALDICPPSILEAAGSSASAPATVIMLNGIMGAPGYKRVFLQISFSNSSPENISLVEGQTFQGIKLLAVDFSSACIRIDNCGQIQTIKICDMQNLTTAAENNSSINTNTADIQSGSEGGGNSAALGSSITPLVQSETGLTAGTTPDNSNTSNTSSGNSNSGNATANSHIYYWWLQDAKDIEQTRIATAQSVLAGEMEPQPLTPLTPPLTPAGLIGPDSVYMEHGPGVLISDQGTVLGIAKRTGN
jgi:hypothetical protein